MGRHYHRLTAAQFVALYETAIAGDGTLHGHARTQQFLIECGYVQRDWAATHAAGRACYRMTDSAWSHLDTHIYWLASRGAGRSRFENAIAANPPAARMALSKSRNAAYRVAKERP